MTHELLMKTCEYIHIMHEVSGTENLESRIANKVLDNEVTDEQLQFIEEVFNDGRMNHVGSLMTPVTEKQFSKEYTTPTYHYPNEAPLDEVQLYNGEPNWIYIHSPVKGRWGETYWISSNCSKILRALPVIKSFKEYDFKIGHFYKVTCTDVLYWGANHEKKKYVFEIEECTESEYMDNGFLYDAWEHGRYDKFYIEQMIQDYQK